MKCKFRVEANNGSKYFTDSEKAFFFYELKKQQPIQANEMSACRTPQGGQMACVQLWKFITPTTQELISPIKEVNYDTCGN
jgi:hypothetical protein